MTEHQIRDAGGRHTPSLGVSWEGRPSPLLTAVAGVVDVLEIVPDCLQGADGSINRSLLAQLDEEAPDTAVTYHGIGLSIGSADRWNEGYLRLLDEVMEWRMPRWHSEHLGFTHVDGSFLGTMPALPTTPEALDLVLTRAQRVQDAYGLEFMLEHVASPLPRPHGMPSASFLNEVSAGSGSRILLDLHNLECDADNGFVDLEEFMAGVDWDRVGEIHVAGGVWQDGWHLDVHSGPVAPSTARLLDVALERATNLDLVVYEVLATSVPNLGVPGVLDELHTLRDRLERVGAAA